MKNSFVVFLFLLTLLIATSMMWLNVDAWRHPSAQAQVNSTDLGVKNWSPPKPADKNLQQPEKTKTQFTHLLKRPLFSPTRRLTAKRKPTKQSKVAKRAPKKQPKVLFDPKKFRVNGVLIQDRQNKVLLSTPDFEKGKWLSVGDVIESWKISKIESTKVEITSGRRRLSIPLYVEKSQ